MIICIQDEYTYTYAHPIQIKQKQMMYIKCMDSNQQQTQKNMSSVMRRIKLPNLDPNCIFTSRPVANTKPATYTPQSKSIPFLLSPNLSKQQHLPSSTCKNNKCWKYSPIKKRALTINNNNISNTDKSNRKQSHQQVKARFDRVNTEPVGMVDDSNKLDPSQSTPFITREKIAQRIIKITQELGMNRADYLNYMKANRSQYPNSTYYREKKRRSGNKFIFNNSKTNIQTIPKNESQKQLQKMKNTFNTSPNQNHNTTISMDRSQNKNTLNSFNTDPKNHSIDQKSMSVYRCILKLKPMPKGQKFMPVQAKRRNRARKGHTQFGEENGNAIVNMNKSIRGWTKYGRIVEEFES